MNEYFAPKMRVSEGCAEVIIPVRPGLFHAAGAVHGSVYFKALDDSAFFAVNSLVDDVLVLTVSFNVYLTRSISEGEMLRRAAWFTAPAAFLWLRLSWSIRMVGKSAAGVGRSCGAPFRSRRRLGTNSISAG